MQEFPKNYNFSEIEKKWQKYWLENNLYAWDDQAKRKDSFVVDTPPPTVSGELHIGHVYSYLQTDFIVRFWRMMGKNIFYPMGFDNNGLPTERLVEKKKNIKAYKMERQKFVDICKEIIIEEEQKFENLFNNIALSVDWSLKYQTISPISQKISQMSFLDLMQKNQVYRTSQPILWDSIDGTALAQADVEEKEKAGLMNEIIFKTDIGEEIIIATTRPELLPACACIFYHPDDPRYQHLQNQYAITPLIGVKVPIIADDIVIPEKGTGLVMCCTFGDQTDILWWRKHNLSVKIIINKQGELCNIPENVKFLEGLKVNQARKEILEELKEQNLIKKQTEITSNVKCAERSGAPLEILMSEQWFIKTIEHKDAMLKMTSDLKWHPISMKIKLENWINGINFDWCISRSRYFGVPFPIWYSKRAGEIGKILLPSIDQLPVDPLKDLPVGYSKDEVSPDMDVMDTWATSSISPQLSSHAISEEFAIDLERHKKLFPFDLRPQAHEILRTWAFYTLLKAHLHQDLLPWHNIMISGWCLASDKTKMSKSKGNIIAPQKLLETHGSDAIRYWAASSKLGSDTAYCENVLKSGKRLVNKLWNAAKFVYSHFDQILEKDKIDLKQVESKITCQIDKWLIIGMNNLLIEITKAMQNYEYSNAISLIEDFFFAVFCDDYLEIVKTRIYNQEGQDQNGSYSAILAIYYIFQIILKLFAPFLPHITEEIYQLLYINDKFSVHQKGSWPVPSKFTLIFNEKEVAALLQILELIRKVKAQKNLSVKAPIKILEIENIKLSNDIINDLKDVISAEEILFVNNISALPEIYQIQDFYVNIIISSS